MQPAAPLVGFNLQRPSGGTPNFSFFALLGFLSFLLRRRELRSGPARIAFTIGIESLRLECEEEGSPLVARVFNENGAVLVDAVITLPFTGVTLVHVNVVDAVAGRE